MIVSYIKLCLQEFLFAFYFHSWTSFGIYGIFILYLWVLFRLKFSPIWTAIFIIFTFIFVLFFILCQNLFLHNGSSVQTKVFCITQFPEFDPFPEPLCGHFRFCRQCGVAGCERVPPSPLCWYLQHCPQPLLEPFVYSQKVTFGHSF